jgi:hypothetical protein
MEEKGGRCISKEGSKRRGDCRRRFKRTGSDHEPGGGGGKGADEGEDLYSGVGSEHGEVDNAILDC